MAQKIIHICFSEHLSLDWSRFLVYIIIMLYTIIQLEFFGMNFEKFSDLSATFCATE